MPRASRNRTLKLKTVIAGGMTAPSVGSSALLGFTPRAKSDARAMGAREANTHTRPPFRGSRLRIETLLRSFARRTRSRRCTPSDRCWHLDARAAARSDERLPLGSFSASIGVKEQSSGSALGCFSGFAGVLLSDALRMLNVRCSPNVKDEPRRELACRVRRETALSN